MRLATKGRYGLRAMIELARHRGEGPLLMSTIASRQDISRKYLHALLTALRAAGLVRSVRGAHGGYTLTKQPGEITVLEIVEALEGSMVLTDCVLDAGLCERSDTCAARGVWKRVSEAMRRELASISLAQVAEDQGRLLGEDV